MDWLRRTFAWMLILGGGVMLFAFALTIVIPPRENGIPRNLFVMLAAATMLGVVPIILGSMLRRKTPVSATSLAVPLTAGHAVLPATGSIPTIHDALTPPPDAIVCLVELTQSDYVRFQYWFYTHHPVRICAILTFMIFVALAMNMQQNEGALKWSTFLPVAVLALAAFCFSPYWSGRTQFRKMPAQHHSIRYEFSPSGYRFSTNDSEAVCRWTTVSEARESRHAFLLKMQPRVFRILPKIAFADVDLPRFRQLLSDQLGDRWHAGEMSSDPVPNV